MVTLLGISLFIFQLKLFVLRITLKTLVVPPIYDPSVLPKVILNTRYMGQKIQSFKSSFPVFNQLIIFSLVRNNSLVIIIC